MDQNQHDKPHHEPDTIIKDHRALEGKQTLMKNMRSNSMWSSVADAMMMTGGPLFATGLIGLAKAFTDPKVIGDAVGFAAKASAAIAGAEGAIMLIAVGAVIATAAVAAKYIASRKWQSSDIDRNDYNAQMTARHMVKEMESRNLCITNRPEHDAPARSDGKSWEHYVSTRRPQPGQDILH